MAAAYLVQFLDTKTFNRAIENCTDLQILDTLLELKQNTVPKSSEKLHFDIKNVFMTINVENVEIACSIFEKLILLTPEAVEDLLNFVKSYEDHLLVKLHLLKVILKTNSNNLETDWQSIVRAVATSNKKLIHLFVVEILPLYLSKTDGNFILDCVQICIAEKNLQFLCYLVDLCLTDTYEAQVLCFCKEKFFWTFISDSLCDKSEFIRKLSGFILERVINFIMDRSLLYQFDYIVSDQKYAKQLWTKYFIILESSREKQVHLVLPSLAYLKDIMLLNSVFLAPLHRILLGHFQNAVVFQTLRHLLESEWIKKTDAFRLVGNDVICALNRIFSTKNFADDALAILQKFLSACENQIFLEFLGEICEFRWNPISIAFVFEAIQWSGTSCQVPVDITIKVINHLRIIPDKPIREKCFRTFMLYMKPNFSSEVALFSPNDLLTIISASCPVLCRQDFFCDVFDPNIFENNKEVFSVSTLVNCNFSTLEVLSLFKKNKNVSLSQILDFCLLTEDDLVGDKLCWFVISNCFILKADLKEKVHQYICKRLRKPTLGMMDNLLFMFNRHCQNAQRDHYKSIIEPVLSDINSKQLALAVCATRCLELNLLPKKQVLPIVKKRLESGNKLEEGLLTQLVKLYIQGTFPLRGIEEVLEMMTVTLEHQNEDAFLILLEGVVRDESYMTGDQIVELAEYCIRQIKTFQGQSNLETVIFNVLEIIYVAYDRKPQQSNSLNPHCKLINCVEQLYELSENIDHLQSKIMHTCYYIIFKCSMMFAFKSKLLDILLKIILTSDVTSNGVADHRAIGIIYQIVLSDAMSLRCLRDAERNLAVDHLVAALIKQYQSFFNKRYFPHSQLHWQKLLIVKMLLLLEEFMITKERQSVTDLLVSSFCAESHQSDVKHTMQWLLLRILSKREDGIDLIINAINSADRTKVSTVTAFIPVLFHLISRHEISKWSRLIELVLPLTMGAHFKLRVYAQILVTKLYKEAERRNGEDLVAKLKLFHDATAKVVAETNSGEVLGSDGVFMDNFDFEKHYYFANIFPESKLSKSPVREISFLFTQSSISTQNQNNPHMEVQNIQKKITPWKVLLEEKQLSTQLGDFILIASLINKPANLGGLARTCEVYGVQKLIISKANTCNDKEFKSLSMSSENWIDIAEVKPEQLKEFLVKLKEEGYTVLAGEQTLDSVRLTEYKFPRKVALVLGNEKEGIPPPVLPYMDVCVEIPQVGLTRSLNVHVAGAMFIWEYAKQHLLHT